MLQKFAPTCAYWTNNENDFDSSFALRSPPKDFLDWMRSIALLSPHETSHDVSCNVKLCTVLLHVCWIKKCMDAPPPPAKRNDNDSLPFQSTQRLRQAFPQRWLSFEWGTVIRPPTNLMQTIKKQCERTLWSVT